MGERELGCRKRCRCFLAGYGRGFAYRHLRHLMNEQTPRQYLTKTLSRRYLFVCFYYVRTKSLREYVLEDIFISQLFLLLLSSPQVT
jgi:hypothetical protein